ncbi:Arsenite methyltransferase [Smittium culicis]|uniref:Arsenite methyltransferase n=1 Tax=Smittium culicis TaxID=133412 RepID=A0A1R1WXL6_9FUNG|nr:Arsenite methyltransferase [Smittium culicis]
MAPKHFAPVWKHFERNVPVGKSKHHRAQCIYCNYELSGQPERMRTHLRKCNKISNSNRKLILRDINDDSELNDNNLKFERINSPISQHNNSRINHSTWSSKNTPGNFDVSSTENPNFVKNPDSGACAISPSKKSFEHKSLSFSEASSKSLKRHRNEGGFLPGSVQGLLGFPWDRTSRSYMSYNKEYHEKPSDTMSNIHHLNRNSNLNPKDIPSPSKNRKNSISLDSDSDIYDKIRTYYSNMRESKHRMTTIINKIAPHPIIKSAISYVPRQVSENYRGCGTPIPMGIEGLRVLDLGCGSGRDCYVVSKLVGPTGEVTGIDMTEEVLNVARDNIPEFSNRLGFKPHLKFLKGYIEFLNDAGLYPESIDLCISNSAVNLSPNKKLVFQSVFEILREGGEFYFSDIYADRRLPNHLRSHPTLLTECLGGALYIEDFKRLCERVGFIDPRQVGPAVPVRIESPEIRDLVRATQFYSITYRMFKHTKPTTILEPTREDYGQVAIYKGTVEGQRSRLRIDNDWCFESNRSVLVDGNTATILSESWLQRHFDIRGDRSCHFGRFITNVPSNVQYDAWELENDENIFYNNLMSNKPSFDSIRNVMSNQRNDSNPGEFISYSSYNFDNENQLSFGYNNNIDNGGNNHSSINNGSLLADTISSFSDRFIQRGPFSNAFFNSPNLRLPTPLTQDDSIPTFTISRKNFANNNSLGNSSPPTNKNPFFSNNDSDNEQSEQLNRYSVEQAENGVISSFPVDKDYPSTLSKIHATNRVTFSAPQHFYKKQIDLETTKKSEELSKSSNSRSLKPIITANLMQNSNYSPSNLENKSKPAEVDRDRYSKDDSKVGYPNNSYSISSKTPNENAIDVHNAFSESQYSDPNKTRTNSKVDIYSVSSPSRSANPDSKNLKGKTNLGNLYESGLNSFNIKKNSISNGDIDKNKNLDDSTNSSETIRDISDISLNQKSEYLSRKSTHNVSKTDFNSFENEYFNQRQNLENFTSATVPYLSSSPIPSSSNIKNTSSTETIKNFSKHEFSHGSLLTESLNNEENVGCNKLPSAKI